MGRGCAPLLARSGARAVAPILLALAGIACGPDVRSRAATASDTWMQQYAITSDGEVQIVGARGSILVTRSDGELVQVKAERIVRAPTQAMAESLVSHVRITEDVSASRVLLRADGVAGSMPVDVVVNFEAGVPAGRRVRVRAADGSVVIRGLTGDAVASTSNGSIMIEDVAGEIEARSENGSISLVLPSGARADLRATAVGGTIHVDGFPIGNSAAEPDRQLRERLNGGGRLISLSARDGDVSIRSRP